MKPHEFVEKWDVTPTQFAAVMGLKSAQASRLLASPDAAYGQAATIAQTDRLDDLDLLMAMNDRSIDRSATLAKVERLLQALEILLKIIGIPVTEDVMGIGDAMRVDCDLIDNALSIQRLNCIFSKKH